MRYSTALFDMDGTLLDTAADIYDMVNHVLQKHGFPAVSQETVVAATGNGAAMLLAACLPEGKDTPDFDGILQEYKDYYAAHPGSKTTLYPGVAELLRELQMRGVKVAIVSNKPDAAAKTLGVQLFPGVPVLGERAGVPRKPAADMIRTMLKQLGADGADAVYIGDSEVDAQTARNAQLDFIGVAWGFRGREKLQKAAPEAAVVDTWKELLEIVG